ncbi:MAG: oxidoreductase [Nocardioides sp.]
MSTPALPDLTGCTYVITGANSGLGFETAVKLAGAGGHVVLAVRDTARGEEAARRIPGSTEVRELDLADLASVRSFAAGFDAEITTLINNAGIMMVAQGLTADGFERQFGTNHIGHYVLTNLLLAQVTDRVVTLSSGLHRGPQINFDDLEFTSSTYSPTRAYQRSKLANLLFTSALQRRLDGVGSSVKAMAAHPGYSATNLQSHHASGWMKRAMALGNRVIATSAEFGSRPPVHAVVADLPGDTYVGPTKFNGLRGAPGPNDRSAAAGDVAASERLWAISEERTGVGFGLPG